MNKIIFVLSMVLVTFCLSPGAYTQGYDKAAQEKAAQDKEAQVKQLDNAAKNQNPQPYAAPPTQAGQNYKELPSSGSAPQFIPCPVTQIEARITSGVPSDWWETPQVGRFQNAQVANIGGAPTLQCFYWAYDRAIPIMKRVPGGMTCTPQGAGFQCR